MTVFDVPNILSTTFPTKLNVTREQKLTSMCAEIRVTEIFSVSQLIQWIVFVSEPNQATTVQILICRKSLIFFKETSSVFWNKSSYWNKIEMFGNQGIAQTTKGKDE